jgi:hypothetical protein
MKSKIDIKSLVLGAVLGIAILFSVGAAADRQAGWEYKVLISDANGLQSRINNSVAEGWQFVSASGIGERSAFAIFRKEKE